MQQRESTQFVTTQTTRNKFVNLLFVNSELRETTFKKTIIFYICMAFIFIGLSIALFIVMNLVKQQRVQYYSPLSKTYCDTGMVCNVSITLNESMTAPIYFMYQLGNFYQNHRRYIQSKSNAQLGGHTIDNKQASLCWPYITNDQMGVSTSWGGSALNGSDIASPCGAIAKTFFTDTFQLYKKTNNVLTQIQINETGISWPGDQGSKYKRGANSSTTQWVDPEDQHFIVWMRTSGLPNFKKLWGRVEEDLQSGDYIVQITNNYNSTDWEGNRFVHLTTKTVFGGKNILLPCVFVVLGVGCIVASIFFVRKWQANKSHLE